jgi:hypothetical protein
VQHAALDSRIREARKKRTSSELSCEERMNTKTKVKLTTSSNTMVNAVNDSDSEDSRSVRQTEVKQEQLQFTSFSSASATNNSCAMVDT